MKYIKNTIALLAISFLFMSLSNCGGAQAINGKMDLIQNPPFKITDAYFQKWVAGVKEGGSGTNIYIVFEEVKPNVVFQDVYFQKQISSLKKSSENTSSYVSHFIDAPSKETIMSADAIKEAQNTPSKPFPFALEENQAIIAYMFEGKQQYYKVLTISKKESIAYPQGNPNVHE